MTVNTPKWYQQIEHEQQLRAAGYPDRVPGQSNGQSPVPPRPVPGGEEAPPHRIPGGEEPPSPVPPTNLPSQGEQSIYGNSRNVGPWQYSYLQPDGSYSPTNSPLHDATITDTNASNTRTIPRSS